MTKKIIFYLVFCVVYFHATQTHWMRLILIMESAILQKNVD